MNAAVDVPAGTVTETGTVRLPELELSVTGAPPVAAAAFNTTVQIDDPDGPREVGLQDKELTVRIGTEIPIVPPVPATTMASPAAEAPRDPASPIVDVAATAVRVAFTTATTPFEITLEFIPEAIQI